MKVSKLTASTLCTAALMISCSGTSKNSAEPNSQMVEADGMTYTACGGAIWVPNEGSFKGSATRGYEVIFTDPQGLRHDLKRVKFLRVKNLSSEPSECSTRR